MTDEQIVYIFAYINRKGERKYRVLGRTGEAYASFAHWKGSFLEGPVPISEGMETVRHLQIMGYVEDESPVPTAAAMAAVW